MVVRPIVKYLLDKGYAVTVATRTQSKADAMIQGHPNGTSLTWTVDDEATLDKLVASHDLTVSLLPYAYHLMVAKRCIANKKNLVTTSYLKPEMKALDQEAKDAGIVIVMELGLDPGIDHMSAMRIIDHVHNKDGKIEEFYSITGALPAPEACDNPFNYKFSWSPKGVVLASKNDGRFLRHGEEVYVPPLDLFKKPFKVDFPDVGPLEIYPNRDSLPYIGLYGIEETKTIYRGTFRHPGWCESLDAIKAMGLIDDEKIDFSDLTYAAFVAKKIGAADASNIRDRVSEFLGEGYDTALDALEFLGMFDDVPVGRGEDTPFELTSDMMIDRMMIAGSARDMVVMQHTFLVSYPDRSREVIKSSMLDFGTLETDTAVARTVALPAACGVEMILEGKINIKGVYIPVVPELYNPILDQLETMDIKMVEEFGLPESEIIR